MAGEQIVLDPTSEDATNTQLDITDATLGYYLLEHDYPPPDNEETWASSADTEGERRANTRRKNRVLTAKVRCIQPNSGTPSIGTIVSNLQRKIGKLNAEGGTYKRVLPSGDSIVFLVLAATIKVPSDKQWITAKKADVELTFTCAPVGLGASITLTTHTATAKAPLVFTETAIKGDVPAIGSLLISNASNDKPWGIWGQQSRYYDSGAGAALFFEAEAGQSGAAAPNAGPTGASGSTTNKVMRHTNVGLAVNRSQSFNPAPAGVQFGHVGSFLVLARVQAASANTGVVSLQLGYERNVVDNEHLNTAVAIADAVGAPIKGSWVIANLGMVTLPRARHGNQLWFCNPYSFSTVATDQVDWDWLALVPVDEGSGIVKLPNSAVPAAGALEISDQGVLIRNSGTLWYEPESYEGDYLIGQNGLPVAGAEGRTARIFVMLAGSASGAGNLTNTIVDAVNLDAITAQITYRPRYLTVPAP